MLGFGENVPSTPDDWAAMNNQRFLFWVGIIIVLGILMLAADRGFRINHIGPRGFY